MNLWNALRLDEAARLALVGAGGKTTAMFHLARSAVHPVVVTTSTHLGAWQTGLADRHLIVTRPEDLASNVGQIEGVTLVSGPETDGARLSGLNAYSLEALYELSRELGFSVLVEADGARQLPLKAPGVHEPVIPSWVDMVLSTVGLSGLGRPLNGETVHRPELFAGLCGLSQGEPITEGALARTLAHHEGGRKGIPAGARAAALLNQASEAGLAAAGLAAARAIVPPFDTAVVADIVEGRIWSVTEPVVGIVLAAGGSTRFGAQKLLQPWQGRPLVRHSVEAALASGLTEVIVVTGADGEAVAAALAGLPVQIARNPEWERGQSTSVRAGLQVALRRPGAAFGAALFFLADQPHVFPGLSRALVDLHEQTMAEIVAPRAGGRRGNPVLFDRALFAELMSLEGDTGGRTLFDRHTVQFVDWDDTKILLDVDTPEDLARLMEEESLGQANHWDQVSRAQTGNDAVQQARVAAVVLAAGQSRRMGQPKMALPWGRGTVIEAVVQLLQEAGVMDIVVVTGGARETVEQALAGNPVRLVHNPQYARSEMVGSLQEGIRALPVDCAAALVVLGDQPGISPEVVRAVIERYRAEGSPLVAPSYQMRRGHPWLAARVTWPELLALAPQDTLRDFLRRHAADMAYVVVDSPAILKDLDTPQDYAEQKPAETS